MRTYSPLLKIAIILLLFLSGCSSSENSEADTAVGSNESTAEIGNVSDNEMLLTEADEEAKTVEPSNESNTAVRDDRMVVYNANLSIQVENYQQLEADIQKKVTDSGGYVVESSVYNDSAETISGSIVLKVPQSSFQGFISDIEQNSLKVIEKSISGNDVTEEYVDLESRLKAKEAVETRLLDLMEKAEKTEDLLKISDDLANVQEEKEQIMGRMNYLKNNVDYSTVSIYLEEEVIKIGSINKNGNLNTWDKSKSLFIDTINGALTFLSSIIVFLIGFSPIIIPIALLTIIWIVYRRKKENED